jgi:hypothetical protein
MQHHLPDVLEEMRGVGVFFRITELMVHPVHYSICSRYQKRRTLEKPGQKIKGFFPPWVGQIHLVRRIAVQEKSVKKQREEPVNEEEQKNYRHVKI